MKSKSNSKTKRFFRQILNPRAWVDFDRIRTGQRYIVDACATYFIPQEKTPIETFSEAKIRLQLSDNDLRTQQKALLRLSLIMLIIACLVCAYAVYNIIQAHFLAAGLSAAISSMASVLAFRYHFWSFQIQKQKLGCTLKEWFEQGLLHKPVVGDTDE